MEKDKRIDEIAIDEIFNVLSHNISDENKIEIIEQMVKDAIRIRKNNNGKL